MTRHLLLMSACCLATLAVLATLDFQPLPSANAHHPTAAAPTTPPPPTHPGPAPPTTPPPTTPPATPRDAAPSVAPTPRVEPVIQREPPTQAPPTPAPTDPLPPAPTTPDAPTTPPPPHAPPTASPASPVIDPPPAEQPATGPSRVLRTQPGSSPDGTDADDAPGGSGGSAGGSGGGGTNSDPDPGTNTIDDANTPDPQPDTNTEPDTDTSSDHADSPDTDTDPSTDSGTDPKPEPDPDPDPDTPSDPDNNTQPDTDPPTDDSTTDDPQPDDDTTPDADPRAASRDAAWLAATDDRVFDATATRAMPDAPRVMVVYEYPHLWPGDVEDRILTPVEPERLDKLADRIRAENPTLVLIDVEQSLGNSPWSGDDDHDDTASQRRANYLAILEGLHERGVTQPIAGYGIGTPRYGSAGPTERRDEVHAYAAGMASLVDAMDYVCVVAYSRYDRDIDTWAQRNQSAVDFARTQYPNRPVLVLLWPLYHDTWPVPEDLHRQPVPWFNEQVDWAREHADLVAVWDGPDTDPDTWLDAVQPRTPQAPAGLRVTREPFPQPPTNTTPNPNTDNPPIDPPIDALSDTHPHHPPTATVRFYDLTNLQGRPDLTDQPGWAQLRLLNAGRLWPGGAAQAERDPLPLDAIRAEAARHPGPDVPLCLNIEHWPVHSDNPTLNAANAAKLIALAQAFREHLPAGTRLGFYGLLPVRNAHAPITQDTAALAHWREQNRALQPLADAVDLVFPSLYAFHDDPDDYHAYATANLQAAADFGKPVIPFLMPVYHPAHPTRAGQPLDPDLWVTALNLTTQHCRGAAIWHPRADFNPTPDWYPATRAFVDTAVTRDLALHD